ncbi:hypothetical protein [Rhodococcoides fascians]|uniref:hypothetical protein n=1 Tax=Rhodococcoides fascians TaxID=1828 RepID=UPI00050CE710|nr:hypothetical protein [Rhodococcus fascians]
MDDRTASSHYDIETAPIGTLALELIREFTRAQDAIDWAVKSYFETKTPDVMFWLQQRGVTNRITDAARPPLIAAVAAAWGVDAQLSNYASTFAKCKDMRDRLAHAASIDPVDDDRLSVNRRTHISESQPATEPKIVSRTGLKKRIHECRWLAAHAHYIQASRAQRTVLGTVPIEWIRPTDTAEKWDGVEFRQT